MKASPSTPRPASLPQIMAVARAAQEGLAEAAKNKGDTKGWRAVITQVLGRLTERPIIPEPAAYYGVNWTEADRKWFGIGVFRRVYRMLNEGGYPSKMLMRSVRTGQYVNGMLCCWDVQEIASGDTVYAPPPSALEPLYRLGDSLDFRDSAIHEDIPESTVEKIYQMPFTMQAYEPNGLSLDRFDTHPSTIFTVGEFSKAVQGVEGFCKERMEKAGMTFAARG